MSGATASELNIFKTLTNPARTDFEKTGESIVSHALERERRRDYDEPSVYHQPQFSTRPSTPPQKSSNHSQLHEEKSPSSDHAHDSALDDPSEKQGILLELHQLENDGVKLTRHFTMDDSLSDMLFELNRIRSYMDTASSVGMLTDGIQLGMLGVEFVNAKWGPVLHLDGWSSVVDQDRERFERVLTKLYKKHWRRGSMLSPEAELAMLLGGSAFMFHFQHKMGADPAKSKGIFGGLGNIMSMFSGARSGSTPTGPGRQGVPETAGSFSERPTMRRPVMRPPDTASFVPPPRTEPPPVPPYTDAMNEEINSLRRERAVLQAQLRKQASSFASPFVVVSSSGSGTGANARGGPEIEELN